MDDAPSLVTARCPDCGPVEVALTAVTLRVNTESERAALLTACPDCSMRFSTPTNVGENLLLASGADLVDWLGRGLRP